MVGRRRGRRPGRFDPPGAEALAVVVEHRRGGADERLPVHLVHRRLAVERGQQARVLLREEPPDEPPGLEGGLPEPLAEVLRQPREPGAADQRVGRGVHMVRDREEPLHLVEPGGGELRQRVLLPVHHALPQRGEHLAETHRGRAGAERFEEPHPLRILRRAEPDPVQVGGDDDRADIVGDDPEPVLPEGEQRDPVFGLEERGQFPPDPPFGDPLEVRPVLDEERQVEEAELRRERVEHRRGDMHLQGPQPEPFQHLLVLAQLARAEDADVHPAGEPLLDQFLEMAGGVVERRPREPHMPQPHHQRPPAGFPAAPASGRGGEEPQREEAGGRRSHPVSGCRRRRGRPSHAPSAPARSG